MKKLSLALFSSIVALAAFVFNPIQHSQTATASQSFVQHIQQNRVALTCYTKNDSIDGGQGTITSVDDSGVWITTAAHVPHDSSYCDAEFRDGSFHTAYIEKEFSRSDVTILFAPRARWLTKAHISTLMLGEHLWVFGEVKPKLYYSTSGDLIGATFVLNDDLYEGTALARMPAPLMHYAANRGNLVLTNLYANPGSSGGAVFDDDGNIVGLVSGGSTGITYIVDLEKSYDEEVTHVQSTTK